MQGNVVDNRYDVVRNLGSGGMGEVFLARDRALDRDVALKVLRSQFAGDRESAERFKREALSAASLSHPNIVQVYDRGDTEDGSSYISMEYVPGGTLKDLIVRDGPLDARTAASYGYQVAEALGAAHAKGVVHRDIKPQNVLISSSGHAKVADFGIARAASAASQTRTGTVMGTAGYMSPEQALGHPATPKSDLYSLGVVLYEAVTGRLPFTAENPIAVSMKHVNEAPRPPKSLNPAVPDAMNAIILRLLSKDPDGRYTDADALAEDLWRARRGTPPAVAAEEAKTVETPTRPPARAARQPAATRRRRSRAPLLFAAVLLLLGLIGMGWALAQDTGGGPGVEVPRVVGLSRDEAISRLESVGFRAEVREREAGQGEAGNVLEQSPEAGATVEEGSTVTLTVGAATVAVPEVVGQGYADAEAELRGVGLAVGSTYDVFSDTAAGVVLEQGVEPGSRVPEGTQVNLGLSTGPAPTTQSASASASAPQEQGGGSSPAPNQGEGGSSPAPDDASASPRAGEDVGEAQQEVREAQKEAREAAKEQAKEAKEEAKE